MTIYKIVNKINKKVYIGQTVQPLHRRWTAHCTKNIKINAIGKAIKKYGVDNFEIYPISRCSSIEEMNHRETYYIKLFNSLAPYGYNLNNGGGNRIPSEETKKRLSESHKGFKISEEIKKKISQTATGRKFTKKHCMNISAAKSGAKNHNFGKKGSANFKSIPIICITDGTVHESITNASLFYKINDSKICRNLSGHSEHAKGRVFEYLKLDALNVEARERRAALIKRKSEKSVLIDKKIVCINTMEIFDSYLVAAKKLNISKSNIWSVLNKKRHSVSGLSFQFLDQKLIGDT